MQILYKSTKNRCLLSVLCYNCGMNYELNAINLPVFYSPVELKGAMRVGKGCLLSASPITALHYHNTMELGVCISGEGETYVENKIYEFKKGCVQVLPPKTPHLSKSKIGNEARWIFIDVDPAELFKRVGMLDPDGIVSLCDKQNFLKGVFLEDEYPALTAAVKKIITENAVADDLRELSVALSVAELLIECDRIVKKTGVKTFAAENKTGSDISAAVDYISVNLDGDLNENVLASVLKVSVSTLRRRFFERTGINPKEFIIRSRMAYAEYLLRKTDLTVIDISLRSGYNEISGFNRTFKNYFGVSPSAYRKKA